MRRGHPAYRIAFNVFALPSALWLGAHVFYEMSGIQPLALTDIPVPMVTLLWPLTVFTFVYFSLNSWLIAFAIYFEKHISPTTIWKDNFAVLSLNYFGGASVAALLVTYTRHVDFTYLAYAAFVIPLLAVLYFTFRTAMGRVEDANLHLSQLNALYMSTIETLAMAIDAKDQITHGHIRRVQAYAVGLAKALGVDDAAQISAIQAASLLHDMGKLAVPEYILNKPGPLTPAEFEKMKMHAGVGADILSAVKFPYPVVPIVRHHHESWDGTGYPDGIAGSDIPIGARILSVVDCFDALTSDRPYRPRLTDKDAIKILQERRGKMYDPLVVDTFVRVHAQIAPSEEPVSVVPSLRAINDLANGGSELSTPSAHLDEISASTDEMLTLFDLARGLNPSMSVPDIGDIIAKHLRRLVPCSLCVFYLFDQRNDELKAEHVAGEHASLVSGLRIPRGQRLSGWVAANRQTIRNSDPVLDFGESARSMSPRPRSCLSTPLVAGGELVGVLTLYSSHRDGFTAEHERVLEIVTKQVAPVIQQATAFQAERAESYRDQVTGLPNTEEFLHFSMSAQHGSTAIGPATLLLIDVDNLKAVNEQLGRRAGDLALGRVVEAARRTLRPSDVLFRDHSDQFIALLLHTHEEVGAAIAARIREAVSGLRSEAGPSLSVSIAQASAPRDSETFQGLLEAARERLHRQPGEDPKGPPSARIH